MFRILLLAVALLLPGVAQAEWREAVSNNFIVVSEESEAALRERVEGLEKFGLVLQALTGAKRPKEPPVKIKIYFVRTVENVQDTLPFGGGGVAGYYDAGVRTPYAVMPRVELGDGPLELRAKTILQHELTHHFMFQYFPGAYPTWYVEGMADYAGVIEIGRDNRTKLGLAINNRILGTRYVWVPLKKLLMARSYADLGNSVIAVYNQGWLLVHYLNSTPEGKKQLADYLNAINGGASFEKAAEALGDLDDLDRKLLRYSQRPVIPATEIRWEGLDPGPVAIRTMSAAENALMFQDLAINNGVPKAKVPAFVTEVRTIAGRFPNDPWALRILTETERMAGNQAEATAAVDRWVAAAPNDALARMHKGMLAVRALRVAKSTDTAAWNAARAHIVAASKLAPRDPQVLKAYYDSFTAQGRMPPAAAQNALMSALDAVPQDDDLRYQVALDFERRDMVDDAINIIRPLALSMRDETDLSPKKKAQREREKAKYAMAGDEDTETPHEMLARLEKKRAADTAKPPAEE